MSQIYTIRDGDRYQRITANGTVTIPVFYGLVGALIVNNAGFGWAIDIYDGPQADGVRLFHWETADGRGYFPLHLRLYKDSLVVVASGTTAGEAVVSFD